MKEGSSKKVPRGIQLLRARRMEVIGPPPLDFGGLSHRLALNPQTLAKEFPNHMLLLSSTRLKFLSNLVALF